MKHRYRLLPLFCAVCLLAALFYTPALYKAFASDGATFDPFRFEGPKMEDLYYVVIRDMDAQLLALSTGKVDVMGDLYRPSDVERLAQSDAVELSLASSFHGFFITFNTRKFPWDQAVLRQAASQVADRKRWTRDLFSGYAAPLSSFLPHISPYYEPDIASFPSGVEAARKRLRDAGWTWDASGRLIAPDGRGVPTTKILCPPSSVVATTAEIAQLMADALVSLGVPAEAQPMDFQAMLARVDEHDFDACTNAWTMSRDPDVLYAFFHSSMDVKGGYNLSGISDSELDQVLLGLRNAPDEPTARLRASEAQRLLGELMPVIPIYSRYSISAIRSDWEGAFTTDRVTVDNLWTLLSMTPKEGGKRPIYWTLPEELRALNPLVSSTAYDWAVLGTIYDSLISVNPYTYEDIPWLAESWDIGVGETGSVLTFTLRPDLKWQDGAPLTVDDVAFTLRYLKDNAVPRFYDSVKDVVSVDISEERTLRVLMANTSFWHLHNIGGMIVLPRHIWERVGDWRTWQPANHPHKGPNGEAMTELIGTGPFIFKESRTGEYIHMTRNRHYMLFDKNEVRTP